jgi:hypothetical protein
MIPEEQMQIASYGQDAFLQVVQLIVNLMGNGKQ